MDSEASSRDHAIAWRPDDATRECARVTRFMEACGVGSYTKLHARSVEDVAWFTERVLEFLDVRFSRPYERVLDESEGIERARWCVGGRLNITLSCVDRHLGDGRGSDAAVVWEGEEGSTRTVTYAELSAAVEGCAAGLRALGIGRGDAVGLHLPMLPETVVALLAVARIGAIAVPLFSGFGSEAIATRLRDVRARAVVTCDGFPRRGRTVAAKPTMDTALVEAPHVEHVVVVRRLGVAVPMMEGRDLDWDMLMALGADGGEAGGAIEDTEAEDALLVLYSSGTTGRPKGILHSHCGFPIKAAQDMAIGTDVNRGDRIAWVTDLGWMMGPWLIYGATLLGATIVLYDGAPDHPGPDRLWALCARHRIDVLGISPSLIRGLEPYGAALPAAHDLTSLRILASTGEPWNPAPWWWLFESVGGGRLPIINYSGGTEISGGILMGTPVHPMKPCAFPAACPGIAADVVDDSGRSIRGGVGELVIRRPWIGMARGFWNDPDRYLETYWARFPGTWMHGDWARVDEDGHWFILGRSDDTLKVAGKRVGPAEVESSLVGHAAVAEAGVIGVPHEVKGTVMVAFCVPVPGAEIAPDLAAELRAKVGMELGKPLRPERVHFVSALPRTRNAKVMRRVIRAAYLGEDPGDVSAVENPDSIQAIRAAAS